MAWFSEPPLARCEIRPVRAVCKPVGFDTTEQGDEFRSQCVRIARAAPRFVRGSAGDGEVDPAAADLVSEAEQRDRERLRPQHLNPTQPLSCLARRA